jgi:WD40 repeat protein
VAFSPDGTLLVSGSADMTVRVWNVKSGTEVLPPLYGHDGTIHSVAFSADGTRIVSGSADNTVRVWDVVSGVEVIQPFCHASSVHSVAFSPNSSYIISGSDDCTVYLWNLETHTEMVPQLRGHDGTVSSVAFALNGGIIISGTDKTLYMWNAINGVLFSSFTPPWSSDHFLLSFIPSVVYQLSHSSAMAPIVILRGGWLVDLSRKIIIMKLPAMVNCTCSGTYEKALAIGTLGGQVIILQFPEELFNSSETQLVEAA